MGAWEREVALQLICDDWQIVFSVRLHRLLQSLLSKANVSNQHFVSNFGPTVVAFDLSLDRLNVNQQSFIADTLFCLWPAGLARVLALTVLTKATGTDAQHPVCERDKQGTVCLVIHPVVAGRHIVEAGNK